MNLPAILEAAKEAEAALTRNTELWEICERDPAGPNMEAAFAHDAVLDAADELLVALTPASVIAALAELAMGNGWEPIETASKDGTEVLAYWPKMTLDEDGNLSGEVSSAPGHIGVSCNLHGGWEPDNVTEASGAWFDDDFEFGEPTHWRALPPPPNVAQIADNGPGLNTTPPSQGGEP